MSNFVGYKPPGIQKWTLGELQESVKASNSLVATCDNLNLASTPTTHQTVKSYILKYNLDISHWGPKSQEAVLNYKDWRKSRTTWEELLVKSLYKPGILL